MKNDVYHAGEIAVQERTGDRQLAERRAGMFGDRLPDGARAFLQHQGVAAVGGAGADGAIWASLWCGLPGFLRSDAHGGSVDIALAPDRVSPADPVRSIVSARAPMGMLVIDLATRQRLRVNGTVILVDPAGVAMQVRETFGNCPKYIQRRTRAEHAAGAVDPRARDESGMKDGVKFGAGFGVEHGVDLDPERLAFIAQTDTLFVASVHPSRGLDVSHRGGEPGFVQVIRPRTLRIPDYVGNGLYQTLGNFEVDSRAGLALIDFVRRRVLSLTGRVVVEFGSEDPVHPTGGTGRYWSFTTERWMEFPLPGTTSWTLLDRSPLNPPAGAP
jgi:predicted pyridoxine 5'-phosphate oxidase superfamily flavin-nucleotide-binding protein